MKYKIITIILSLILAAGIAGSVLVFTAPSGDTVQILSDGKTLYTFDLSATEDMTLEIPCGDHINVVEIRDHRIRVASADCPDLTCVRMGWLSSAAMPIVCLPHHLVITYADGGDVDAVTR